MLHYSSKTIAWLDKCNMADFHYFPITVWESQMYPADIDFLFGNLMDIWSKLSLSHIWGHS